MKTKLLIMGFILGIISCDKEHAIKPAAKQPAMSDETTTNANHSRGLSITIQEKNGRLIFESRDEFEIAMNELSGYSPAEIKDWSETQFPNFRSLHTQYIENDGLEEDKLMTSGEINNEFIDAIEFSSVLNSDGVVQIGHRIYKVDFAGGYIYIIPDGNEDNIPYFDQNAEVEGRVLKRPLSETEDNEIYTVQYDGTWEDSDRCSESGMGNRYNRSADNTYVLSPSPGDGTDVRRQWSIVDYDRYGIYYSMKSKCAYEYRNT